LLIKIESKSVTRKGEEEVGKCEGEIGSKNIPLRLREKARRQGNTFLLLIKKQGKIGS
jgi:hypothetical protein